MEELKLVVAALASLHRMSSDVNGLSVAIDKVNRMQAHFEFVLKAGGRIAGPKVERSELNTKPMTMAANKMSDSWSQTGMFGDSEGCLSESKQEHTELSSSGLFNSQILQNGGVIDLVESMRMLEVPSQSEAKTVVSCSCSNSIKMPTCPMCG